MWCPGRLAVPNRGVLQRPGVYAARVRLPESQRLRASVRSRGRHDVSGRRGLPVSTVCRCGGRRELQPHAASLLDGPDLRRLDQPGRVPPTVGVRRPACKAWIDGRVRVRPLPLLTLLAAFGCAADHAARYPDCTDAGRCEPGRHCTDTAELGRRCLRDCARNSTDYPCDADEVCSSQRCQPHGRTLPGDPCRVFYECVAGYACSGYGPRRCLRDCSAVDGDTSCPAGLVCAWYPTDDTALSGFSVCVEACSGAGPASCAASQLCAPISGSPVGGCQPRCDPSTNAPCPFDWLCMRESYCQYPEVAALCSDGVSICDMGLVCDLPERAAFDPSFCVTPLVYNRRHGPLVP